MSNIHPRPKVLEISPYQGGESHVAGQGDILKLSSNENPSGPPVSAQQALVETAAGLHRYPSSDHHDLRAAIAETHDLDMERIICGCGSDELIAFLCQAYAGDGDEVIYTEHGFAMFRISALASGATPVEVGETDRTVDVDKILAACSDRTRLVFIANPANPTGTVIAPAEIARLADALPPQVLLVLDGAYAEFMPDYDGGAGLIATRDNIIMTRTFSKLYGLGGLRVGWAYGPPAVIDILNRVRGPFNLSVPALAAATVAIKDREFAKQTLRENARCREFLAGGMAQLGFPSDPSFANFILVRFQNADQAQAADAHLRENGIIVRQMGGYKLPHCLRITIPDMAGCERVLTAMRGFMGAGE